MVVVAGGGNGGISIVKLGAYAEVCMSESRRSINRQSTAGLVANSPLIHELG